MAGKPSGVSGTAIAVELSPEEFVRLGAMARERERSIPDLARELLTGALGQESSQCNPRRTSLGILKDFGPAPSDEEIATARAEFWKDFAS